MSSMHETHSTQGSTGAPCNITGPHLLLPARSSSSFFLVCSRLDSSHASASLLLLDSRCCCFSRILRFSFSCSACRSSGVSALPAFHRSQVQRIVVRMAVYAAA
jgi:hypothetical protein